GARQDRAVIGARSGAMPFSDQSRHPLRFDWGRRGLEAIGPGSDVVIVIDVLSFSTCIDVATSRSAAVLPWRWRDDSAAPGDAILASAERSAAHYSLSPASLQSIPARTRLVLPSPNGSALSLLAAEHGITLTACLRNAAAVAAAAGCLGRK